ncbi:hypothetical protein BJY52DRAFT_241191 [Lactarius psammicola]|nr:hypothetical protein BJY52DRAFT_241191 [Lactarius psammicola]
MHVAESLPYSRTSGRRRRRKCASARLASRCVLYTHGVSEMVAQTYRISRQKQRRICARFSHQSSKGLAPLSWARTRNLADDVFSDEIVPGRSPRHRSFGGRRPNVSADSEGLAALLTSFAGWDDASTTAGNANGVADGAPLCILTSLARAEIGLNHLILSLIPRLQESRTMRQINEEFGLHRSTIDTIAPIYHVSPRRPHYLDPPTGHDWFLSSRHWPGGVT